MKYVSPTKTQRGLALAVLINGSPADHAITVHLAEDNSHSPSNMRRHHKSMYSLV